MNYKEAHNYIFNEIGDEGYTLLNIIAKDEIKNGLKLIMELTNCNIDDAKLIWVDLKMEYGTSETNPFVESYTHPISYSNPNIPKCPTCGSTNIRKIGTGERAASVIGFGILSRKINKTWKCNNCSHTW